MGFGSPGAMLDVDPQAAAEVGLSPAFVEWHDSLFATGTFLRENFDVNAASETCDPCILAWAQGYGPPTREVIVALREAAPRLAERIDWELPPTGILPVEPIKSEYLAPKALALWFSRLDEDNWFDFQMAEKACDTRTVKRENTLIMCGGVTTQGAMPLVVNTEDATITAFSVALND